MLVFIRYLKLWFARLIMACSLLSFIPPIMLLAIGVILPVANFFEYLHTGRYSSSNFSEFINWRKFVMTENFVGGSELINMALAYIYDCKAHLVLIIMGAILWIAMMPLSGIAEKFLSTSEADFEKH